MNEKNALLLTFTTLLLVTGLTFVGLTLVDVKDSVLTAAIVLIACVGAHIISRVVMHYPPSPADRRRR